MRRQLSASSLDIVHTFLGLLRFGLRGLGLLLLLALLGGPPVWGAENIPAEISLRARGVQPGEPVQIQVDLPTAASELNGKFLGMPVHFELNQQLGSQQRWLGWSLVPLDAEAGLQELSVSGSGASGETVVGSLAFEIEAKEFPTEELKVASRYVEPPEAVQRRLAEEREKLQSIYRLRTADQIGDRPFVRPVDGVETSVFGTRRIFNGKPRSPHPGQDLRAATGTPVKASAGARVVLSMDLYYSGNTVILDHGGGLFTLYAHLSRLDVAEGAQVEAGQQVGLAGATGRVTGPHLHWGAKIGDLPFNPMALLDPAFSAAQRN